MILRRMCLRQFRNYATLDLEFCDTLNFICGRNGQGKSNFLEAVHLLGVTRSFRASPDRELVQFDGRGFEIMGEFFDEAMVKRQVAVCYSFAAGKEISLDRKRLASSAALIGKFPVVHFAPESHRITSGAPAERRRFVDMLLSQSSAAYLADWQAYHRALKQRNALLSQNQGSSPDLSAWNQTLAIHGCRIIAARYQFVESFATIVLQAYRDISASSSSLHLRYHSQLAVTEVTPDHYHKMLAGSRVFEKRRRQTQAGPHRDDFGFILDGHDLRGFASRGEHKSTLLALKMAEATYLEEKSGTAPIILLDDLHSELDATRFAATLEHFQRRGQLFVTSLAPLPENVAAVRFEVTEGRMTKVNHRQAAES